MDIADISDRADAVLLDSAVKSIQQKSTQRELPVTGYCHNCESQCEGLFCDAECRDEYEQYVRTLKLNGKYHERN